MSTYIGYRSLEAGETRVEVDGKPLPLRLDVIRHSPTGFEWGYGGSGPSQLAIAILCHHLGVPEIAPESSEYDWPETAKVALRLHQDFKFAVIGSLPRDAPSGPALAAHRQWEMTSEDVDRVIAQL